MKKKHHDEMCRYARKMRRGLCDNAFDLIDMVTEKKPYNEDRMDRSIKLGKAVGAAIREQSVEHKIHRPTSHFISVG